MAELLNYKCPHCDAPIQFEPGIQNMKCPYCDSEFDVAALKSKDEVLNSQPADSFEWDEKASEQWDETNDEGLRIFVCKSCGGEIVGDENTAATKCPYCDNPVVLSGRLSGVLKPNYVIPFKLDKNQAKQSLKDYVNKKKFVPNLFRSENHLDEIRGIYVPFWLFDSDVDAQVSFDATKVSSWSDSKYNYTKTDHFDVFRKGSMSFENIPVDGASKMPDDLMESIEPFDFSEAVDFQTAYLAGFLADKYDVDKEASIPRANERIKVSAEDTLRSTVSGYSSVTAKSSSVQLIKGSSKYALYPVWILNTTYKGNKYLFAMNGQTGKFIGNLPVSNAKLGALFAGLFTGISVLAILVSKMAGLL
ncbi:MAG: IBR domain-containing protein [Clostridia bacterium]|nr:IBR domain-containing protein [Clostridia bacterium]